MYVYCKAELCDPLPWNQKENRMMVPSGNSDAIVKHTTESQTYPQKNRLEEPQQNGMKTFLKDAISNLLTASAATPLVISLSPPYHKHITKWLF